MQAMLFFTLLFIYIHLHDQTNIPIKYDTLLKRSPLSVSCFLFRFIYYFGKVYWYVVQMWNNLVIIWLEPVGRQRPLTDFRVDSKSVFYSSPDPVIFCWCINVIHTCLKILKTFGKHYSPFTSEGGKCGWLYMLTQLGMSDFTSLLPLNQFSQKSMLYFFKLQKSIDF